MTRTSLLLCVPFLLCAPIVFSMERRLVTRQAVQGSQFLYQQLFSLAAFFPHMRAEEETKDMSSFFPTVISNIKKMTVSQLVGNNENKQTKTNFK